MNNLLESGEVIMAANQQTGSVLAPHAKDGLFWIILCVLAVIVIYPFIHQFVQIKRS